MSMALAARAAIYGALATMSWSAADAPAQSGPSYPAKPIRWIVGYTPNLAMAVWIGNHETEFPLRDSAGGRVTGAGLPSEIYRAFMPAACVTLGLAKTPFADPSFGGNAVAGDG